MRVSRRWLGTVLAGIASAISTYACGDSGGVDTTVGASDASSDGGIEGSIVIESGVPSDGAVVDAVAPPPLMATRLAAGTTHACAIRSDTSIACWGDNTAYQLGVVDAGGTSSPVPVPATTLTGAVSATATFATGCALLDTGELGCWGSNSGGLLGNLSAPSFSATPVKVGNLSDVVAVTGGEKHACLLRAGGKPFCWGNNDDEQLGSGIAGAGNSAAPAAVKNGTDSQQDWKSIGSGPTSSHTCGIRKDDQVVCWGLNNHTGQLGAPTFDDLRSPSPLLVDNVTDAIRVATGTDHSCAIRKGGTLRCWGANDNGQLGFGTPGPNATEKIAGDVPGINDAVAVALGDKRTCVVHSTGKVSCFGNDPNGALGGGGSDAAGYSVTPVEVTGISDAQDVSLGSGFSCALRAGGKVSCWGANDKGQLGAGSAAPFSGVPLDVVGF